MFWTYNPTNIGKPISVIAYVRYIILIIGLLTFQNIQAQDETPSIVRLDRDTAIVTKEVIIKEEFIPVPKKALLYSLILPGAGQIYNRKYWKLPLVYAAYGGLVYAFDYNGTQHKRFKTAYEYRVDGNPLTNADELVNPAVTDDAIKRARDGLRKDLEVTYMAAIIVHALNGIEAYVDAHLRNFDISEDLSLDIRPTFESNAVGVQSGVGVFLTF